MRKTSILLLLLLSCTTLFSQLQYNPVVAWSTVVTDVVMTDTTYNVTVTPYDINDVGSGQIEVGYYLQDFVGHKYSILEKDVDANPYRIKVRDDFHVNESPQTGQMAFIYRSVGDGQAPYIAPINDIRLDQSGRDYSKARELDILWRNKLGTEYADDSLVHKGRTETITGKKIFDTSNGKLDVTGSSTASGVGILDVINSLNNTSETHAISANVTGTNASSSAIVGTGQGGTIGVQGGSTSGSGVYGSSGSGAGVKGESTSGYGVWGKSNSGVPLYLSRFTSATNTVVPMARRDITSSGTTANGFGASDEWQLETTDGFAYPSGQIINKWTNATYGSETSSFEWWLRIAGAAIAKKMELSGTGKLTVDSLYTGSAEISETSADTTGITGGVKLSTTRTTGARSTSLIGLRNTTTYNGAERQDSVYGIFNTVTGSATGVINNRLFGTNTIVNNLAGGAANVRGNSAYVYNGGLFSKLAGSTSYISNTSTNPSNNDAYGYVNTLVNSGVIDGYSAFQTDIYNNTGGTITDVNGLQLSYYGDGGGTTTNVMGVNIGKAHAWTGTATNSYGIYIDPSTNIGTTISYAIYSGSLAPSYFAGNIAGSQFVKSGGTSAQFLKADGSSDNSTYLTSEVDGSTTNEIQTLDQVLTQGATSMQSILVRGVTTQNAGGQYASALGDVGSYGSLALTDISANKTGALSINPLTDHRSYQLPNASGTLALAATTLAGYGITDAIQNQSASAQSSSTIWTSGIIKSSHGFQAIRAGSGDNLDEGAYIDLANSSNNKQGLIQLNANEGFDYWFYNGSDWVKVSTLTNAGALSVASTISATGGNSTQWNSAYTGLNAANLTTNYLPKWDGSKLVNSPIYTDGTKVGIGVVPNFKFEVTNSAGSTVNDGFYLYNTDVNSATGGRFLFNPFTGYGVNALILQEFNNANVYQRNIITFQNGTGFIGIDYIDDPTSGNKFAVNGNTYIGGTVTATGAITAPNLPIGGTASVPYNAGLTVTIGSTMANATYKVSLTPTAYTACTYWVTNKTTTTFDIVVNEEGTAAFTMDWILLP